MATIFHQIYEAWFRFPDGGLWSNLLASAIWALPTFVSLHRKLDRHHREYTKHKK